jgi:hypothetical protein
MKYAKGDIFKG